MASISNAHLDIKHNHDKKTARVVVTAQVTFSPIELFLLKNGLTFRLKGALKGADSGLKGADDHLWTFKPIPIADRTPQETVKLTFEETLGEDVLDEDKITNPKDEVYARLTLVDQYTGREYVKDTNEVSHYF